MKLLRKFYSVLLLELRFWSLVTIRSMNISCYLTLKDKEIQVTSTHENVFDVLTVKPLLIR
jgi:hypothetical protein